VALASRRGRGPGDPRADPDPGPPEPEPDGPGDGPAGEPGDEPGDGPGGGPAAVRLRLAPERAVVVAGDRFEVRLEAAAAVAVSHLPVVVEFDPGVLAVERVEAGEFLGAPGQAQVLADASEPGRLVVGASRLGAVPGVAGAGTVARIRFRALAAGVADIGFARAAAKDGDLRAVAPLATEAARVRIRLSPVGSPRPRDEVRPQGGEV
jgi:hypothetical protein